MALLFIGAIQSSAYALTVGQHIENQAQVYYSVAGSDKSIETNKVETEIGTVPATLEFLAYDANHADKNVTLQSTSYYASSGLNTMSAPRLNSGEVLDTTHIIPVRDGDIYASNDLLIVRVIDIEANQLIGVIDKIEVTLINGEDRETLQLRESEINSGVFVGYIQLVNQENTQGDGELYVQPNDTISGTYQQISDSAKIAPEAKVFLSENGKVLANVEVFLLDAITGEVRYSTITDENGVYSFANVEAGNYILYSDYAVTPQVAEGASVGAAYVDSGYESFSIKVLHTESGPFLAMDIPFSRKEVSVWLEKQASKERVGLGEFIQYTIVVHNDTEQMVTHLKLEDILPRGLKYQKDSFTLDGETTTPIQSSDGQTLSVTLSHFIGKSIHTVRYVAEVTAGIKGNNIVNEAWLRGADNQIHSNIASSVVKLEKELFTDKGVIAGKIVDLNSSRAMQGVRLYLENAAYVVTDREGKYHFEEIDMGMHVLQVDKESLLDGYEVVPCENSLEKKGSNFSKFVEFKHGGLKRVDFCIENVEGIIHKNTEEKVFTQEKEKMPTYGASDIASQIKKHTILWPPKGYIPAIPSTKLAIVHPKDERAVVYLNGSRVSLFNYDTSINGKKREKVMTLYKGVDLLQGDNLFEVKFFSKQGEYTSSVKREIHISGAPMSLKYHEDKSQLIADGKTSPVVAVQFFDADGYPLREGTQGSYQIEAPYRSQVSLEELENNPLALSASSNRFIIEREGIAYIKLQPTSKSGEAKLSFTMDNQEVKIVKSWLKPEPRDWILVGFAQGSVGYETLKSNSETSDENSDIYKDGRVAFFAKGKVKGEWILSLAYDSGKKEEKQKLEEEIDPNQYYTLYGDDSEQHYDASSQKKLYVKLEKSNFYALFGNFQTGLTTTELSQYHRAMHGVKSEYHDKYVEGSFFVSKSDQMFQRDEIAGDGTSGFYHLSQKNLIMNSETITLEVRDRYRNEIVVSTEKLRRYQDYEIDYTLGRLYFKKPIYRNDENFNPQYIVVEYELNANAVESYTYGARAVVKPTEKIAIASTYVNEDSGLMQKQLLGFDAEIELGQQTRLRAEYAQTDIKDDNLTQTGSAKYLALEHLVQGVGISAYFREQEGAFGLGQLSTQLGATRKIGVDVHKRFSRWLIESSFYRDEMLNTENFNDVAELNLGYDDGYWGAIIGYRYIKNSVEKGVNQINMMLSRSLFDHKLHLSVSRDQSLGSKKIENYPTRTAVQANYNITSSVEVFGTYEINEVEETSTQTRAGMRVRPWSGATVESSQMSELNTEGSRVYNLLGFQQQLQVVENIGISMGYEQANKVKSTLESEEFEAYNIGANYNSKRVTGNIRAELKQGALEDKKNLQSAVYTQHGDDLALALGGRYVDSKNDSDNNRQVDAKVALAYRAEESKWMILSQLAYLNTLREGSKEYIKTAKLISNTFLNYKPNQQTELLFSYGLKHVLDSFDRTSGDYESYIDFAGLDMSYALSSGFDMGLQGALLHSYSGENMEYSSGIYVGYNLFDNSWLRVGYNLTGFSDDDFSLQNYHRSGIYLQFNMKFDQESLKNSAGSLVW